jgi:hypothetical protein
MQERVSWNWASVSNPPARLRSAQLGEAALSARLRVDVDPEQPERARIVKTARTAYFKAAGSYHVRPLSAKGRFGRLSR